MSPDARAPPSGRDATFPRQGLLLAACRRPLGLAALFGAVLSGSVLVLGDWLIGPAMDPLRQYVLAALAATSALFVWVLAGVARADPDAAGAAGLWPRPAAEPPAVEGERWRTLGDERLQAGDLQLAAAAWQRALSLAGRAGDRLGEAAAERRLATVARRGGDAGEAERRLRRAYERSTAAADRFGMAAALIDLADLARDAGGDDLARRHLEEAKEHLGALGEAMGPEAAALLRAATDDRAAAERA